MQARNQSRRGESAAAIAARSVAVLSRFWSSFRINGKLFVPICRNASSARRACSSEDEIPRSFTHQARDLPLYCGWGDRDGNESTIKQTATITTSIPIKPDRLIAL